MFLQYATFSVAMVVVSVLFWNILLRLTISTLRSDIKQGS
jgi:hypothetical protein